jgi:hypothetical protein
VASLKGGGRSGGEGDSSMGVTSSERCVHGRIKQAQGRGKHPQGTGLTSLPPAEAPSTASSTTCRPKGNGGFRVVRQRR